MTDPKDALLADAARLLRFTPDACLRGGGAGGQTIENMRPCGECRRCLTRAWLARYEAERAGQGDERDHHRRATMSYPCQREFHMNDFHRVNYERQREAFAPPHPLMALVACVQEEVGELAAAVLGVTGEKKRKAHLTNDDVLDAVADAMTYLSLIVSNVGCEDLEGLLGRTFNMVSRRAGSKLFIGDGK